MTATDQLLSEVKGLRRENKVIMNMLKQLTPAESKKDTWVRIREFNIKLKYVGRAELTKEQFRYMRETRPQICRETPSGHYQYNITEYLQ